MMKPISAAILNIRGTVPGTATIGNGATNLAKDIIRVANIAYNISQVEQKSGFLLVTGEKASTNRLACICWDNKYPEFFWEALISWCFYK